MTMADPSDKRRRSYPAGFQWAVGAALATMLAWVSTASAETTQPGAASPSGGLVARVLPPAEKIKLLEEDLSKEIDRRVKLEQELGRRNSENAELMGNVKSLQKERSGLEGKLAEAREREQLLQRTNDRLREETERVTVSVRFALPVIAGIAIMIMALIVWVLLYLRQIGSRVHGQRTLSEMHELEGRLIHTNDLLSAEVKRTQALRNKLAEFGISD
jgi:hypothetical protein